MEMSCRAVATAVKGKIIAEGPEDRWIRRFVIDSRQVSPGDFFVPLAGEQTDGHKFIGHAAQKGAIGCFVRENAMVEIPPQLFMIAVPDPLVALQELAAFYRQKFDLSVVGVTGSVGKTTTKDLIAAVLSARFKTLKTEGNLNNEIGLPLMLLRLDSSVEAAVLEMGMSGFGEIKFLAGLARPSIGVITNIGESHLEALGSREGIARAKGELLEQLPADGLAIVNAEEPLLVEFVQKLKRPFITFGFKQGATIRCTAETVKDGRKLICLGQENFPELWLEPPLPGKHNLYNLMAAVAVGRHLKLADSEIVKGLKDVTLSAMRLETVTLPQGYNIINDAYNASPTSMAAALEVLQELAQGAGKIAVLGDMLELGDLEKEGHLQVGRLAAKSGLKALVVMGRRARWIAQGAEAAGMPGTAIFSCATHVQAADLLQQLAEKNDWILLKGSRGMKMEEVLYALRRGVE
ncbi:MAG: UDP-N-acetylmuramoyl-tripeptide--D-alanyl-D-alanine ligase [Firmicutes bacterium]|nr:UDP-N-acetylmuramoyl-tripeptide--D-alanyl-D-alanine ligase [Bacillota bacterium]